MTDIDDIKARIEKLTWFDREVSSYFSDSLTVLELAIKGATALGGVTVDAEGHYYTNGQNMDWISSLRDTPIQTTDRGTDPKLSLIQQEIDELHLSKEAENHYRQLLTALLDGQPASEWPRLISDFTNSLFFDEDNNIIKVFPVNIGAGDGFLVFKNGQYDADYSRQLNQERNSQLWESLGENALQLLAGIASILIGTLGLLSGGSISLVGLGLAPPTGGASVATLVPAGAFVQAGSIAILSGGVVLINDPIITINSNQADLQISFAQQGPTSRTIDPNRPIEAKVNGKKERIRVDAEPYSGNGGNGRLQVQSGSGKKGYGLDVGIDMNDITNKQDIIDFVNKKLKGLHKSVQNTIIERLWRGYQWIQQIRGN